MTLKLAGVFLFLQMAFHVPTTYGLDCYDCTNIQNVSDCHNVMLCNSYELCYTDATGVGLQTRFSMGCRSIDVCGVESSTTMLPISIIGRDVTQSLDCSQCCGTDGCNKHMCTRGTPVQWSRWSEWGICSVSCGVGLERRDRTCSNPYPGPHGDPCWGDARDYRACFTKPCADGGWSPWSTWGSCTRTCLGGQKKRTRTCDHPSPSKFGRQCVGNNEETEICNSVECPVTNGAWSSWGGWESCSRSCYSGIKRRNRTCTNPVPSLHGQMCPGNSEQVDTCNNIECPYVRIMSDAGGRLEVFINGEWGTVCDDRFDENNNGAKVICRMLGHSTSNARVLPHGSVTGGSGRIWFDDVRCAGTESTIFDCPHVQPGDGRCVHDEDVGVAC